MKAFVVLENKVPKTVDRYGEFWFIFVTQPGVQGNLPVVKISRHYLLPAPCRTVF